MSVNKLRRLPLAAAALVACVGAQADYQSPDGKFRMSGFGTLGTVVTDTSAAKFTYASEPDGATRRPNENIDSKIAVQGTYKFTPTISATSQIMTKYTPDGSYESDFEWAFLKWQPLPSLSIRAGRTGAPLFMISDFRDVGYANTLVRPPADVYDQVPFSTVDGGDISLQHTFGPATLTGQLWGGTSKNTFGEVKADIARMRGVNFVAEFDGGYTFRVGRVQSKLSYTAPSLTALAGGANLAQQILNGYSQALAGFGQAAAASQYAGYANQYGAAHDLLTVDGDDASFTGIGFSVDHENWVGAVEYTKRKTKSVVVDSTGWYTMAGYRFGSYTPYVSISKLKVDRLPTNPVSADAAAGLNAAADAALSPSDAVAAKAGLAPVPGGVDAVIAAGNYGQKTLSFGVRWDAAPSLAIKAQLDHIKTDGGPGLFNEASDSIVQGKAVNVLSLVLDFVF